VTAFRFVTLVCDQCFTAFDPGTALTERDARADATDRGWTSPSPDEDRCRNCSEAGSPPASGSDLEIGVPVLISAR